MISNWAFKFNSNNIIEFKNLYNQSSSDQYVDRIGTGISTGQVNGSFDKVYRGIYTGQLNGSHDLFGKQTLIEWFGSHSLIMISISILSMWDSMAYKLPPSKILICDMNFIQAKRRLLPWEYFINISPTRLSPL